MARLVAVSIDGVIPLGFSPNIAKGEDTDVSKNCVDSHTVAVVFKLAARPREVVAGISLNTRMGCSGLQRGSIYRIWRWCRRAQCREAALALHGWGNAGHIVPDPFSCKANKSYLGLSGQLMGVCRIHRDEGNIDA